MQREREEKEKRSWEEGKRRVMEEREKERREGKGWGDGEEVDIYIAMRVMCVYVLFNVVIQTASRGKPTRHPVFYMLIRTHEAQ